MTRAVCLIIMRRVYAIITEISGGGLSTEALFLKTAINTVPVGMNSTRDSRAIAFARVRLVGRIRSYFSRHKPAMSYYLQCARTTDHGHGRHRWCKQAPLRGLQRLQFHQRIYTRANADITLVFYYGAVKLGTYLQVHPESVMVCYQFESPSKQLRTNSLPTVEAPRRQRGQRTLTALTDDNTTLGIPDGRRRPSTRGAASNRDTGYMRAVPSYYIDLSVALKIYLTKTLEEHDAHSSL